MSDIFLSYSSQDRSRVLPLVRALERHGWSVWWDRQIRPGKTFDQVIEEALQGARCVVVVWSKASVQSDWVRAEAEAAKSRRILVPVRIDREAPIPLSFSLIQAASLWDWQGTPSHPEFEQFILAVTDLIGLPKRAPVSGGKPVEPPPRRRVEVPPLPRQKLEDPQKPNEDRKPRPAWIERRQLVAIARAALARVWKQPLAWMVGGMLCVLTSLLYFAFIQQYPMSDDRPVRLHERRLELLPVPGASGKPVSLQMNVVEGKADVYRDGQRIGTTPYQFTGQPGERAEFTFKLDGYDDLTKSVEIPKKDHAFSWPMSKVRRK